MERCEKFSNCAFFSAVRDHDEMIDVLNEYVSVYCCGPLQKKCWRLNHFHSYGVFPGNTISPSGLDFRKYTEIEI